MELQLGNTLMLMKFRFVNLCIKSDAASLLTVKVTGADGSDNEIEKVGNVSILDDDNMLVVPFDEGNMKKLRLAIKQEHPEFKQHIETIDLDEVAKEAGVPEEEAPQTEEQSLDPNSLQVPDKPIPSVLPNDDTENLLHVLVLTVPQVDEDRRKVLLDSVKAYVDATKVRFDATINKAKAEVTRLSVGLPKEEVDEAEDKVKEAAKLYRDAVVEAEESKTKEIEEAYKRYLEKQAENPTVPEASGGDDNAFSMKFDEL